jgi:hypothetical protein
MPETRGCFNAFVFPTENEENEKGLELSRTNQMFVFADDVTSLCK